MKIKKDVVFRSVADENMLIPVGETVGEYNGIFTLTEVGAQIWKLIEKGSDENQIVKEIIKEYEIDEETAKKDVEEFIDRLCSLGIVER
ncbi:MAG: PqqD family protein [Acutalibacteraceae bacterium]